MRAAAGDADGAQRAASAARDLYAQKGATVVVDVAAGAPATTTPAATTSDPSAESTAIEPSDEPWNEADQLSRRHMQLYASGDLVAWEAMLDDNSEETDPASGEQLVFENKADFVRLLTASLDAAGGALSLERATVATRGDDLEASRSCTGRCLATPLARESTTSTSPVVCGPQTASISFDVDDLRAAAAELDRRHLVTVDPIQGATDALNRVLADAIPAGDLDRIMRCVHPAMVMTDHRPLGWGSSRFDDFRERMRTLTEQVGSETLLTRRVWRRSGTLSCHANRVIATTAGAGQLATDQLIVSRWDPATGLSIRIDQFADDELDEALACFEAQRAEVDNVVPAPNTAVLAGGVANVRARTASLDEFVAMFTDDFTATLTDGSTVTIDDLRTGTVEPTAVGYGVTDRRIMSVLTDRLAMLYVGTDEDTGHWSVEEVDDTGRLRSVRQYEHVADAADALDTRWGELDRATLPSAGVDQLRWIRHVDIESMATNTAADFQLVDHRELGFPSSDRDQYIEIFSAAAELIRADVLVVRNVRASCADGWVVDISQVRDTGGGHWYVGSICVVTFRDGLLHRLEQFSDGDLDAAMARYHELVGIAPPAVASPTQDEPWNDADRWMRQAIELRSAGRFEEWARCFDEDVVWVSHRAITGGSYHGRDEVSAAYGANDLGVSMSAEPLATRGDTFALQRHVWRYDEPDIEFEFLLLTRWSTDGLLTEAAVHDLVDLRAAVEQLDEWYLHELAPIDAARMRATSAYFDAVNDRDLDRAVSTLASDVVSTTHRPVSWGTLDRDGVAAGLASITEFDGDVVYSIERLEFIGPSEIVVASRLQFTDRSGNVMVDRWVTTKRCHPASGLTALMEHVLPDRIDDARATSTRLAAESNADPMVSSAVIAGGLGNALVRFGKPHDFQRLLADDFSATLADGSTVTRDDIASGVVDPSRLGLGRTDRRAIAAMSDRLALLYIGADDGAARWSVEEVDHEGRISRIRQFDGHEIVAAANYHEAQLLANHREDQPLWSEADAGFCRAHRERDLAQLEVCLHAEFVLVDRRELGYSSVDRQTFIDLFAVESVGISALIVQELVDGSERVGVSRTTQFTLGDSGGLWESVITLSVLEHREGKVARLELFQDDDLDAAMARFHELDGSEAPADTTWNRADRAGREFALAVATGRVGEVPVDDLVVVEDRRSMLSNTYNGRDSVIDGWRTTGTVRPWNVEFDTLAVRGDDLALIVGHFSKVDDPDTSIENVLVIRVNADGLIDRAVMFDPEDLAAAVDELNRLHLETLDALDAGQRDIYHHAYAALTTGDLDSAMAVIDPEFQFIDHRPLGWGTFDASGMRERFRTITENPDHIVYLTRFHGITTTRGCYSARNRVQGADGAILDEDLLFVVSFDPVNGLMVRTDQFEPDDVEAALAQLDDLESTQPPRTPANRAVIAGGLANHRARLPQLDRFLDCLNEDFTATLPDGAAVTQSDLRAGTVSPDALGFGVTDRGVIAARGERLALLRIEGAHWSIEEIDEHDRLVRVTLFDNDDLLAARNTFDEVARAMPDAEAIPPVLWAWLRAHANYDLDGLETLTHDDVSMVDHRQLGYAPMAGKIDAWALIRSGLDDETLRGVPVYGVTLMTSEHAAVIRGGIWFPAGSDDYWESNPFIGVYGCSADKLRTVDLFAEHDLDAALTRFQELAAEALADTSWNLADRVGRDFASEIATGRVGETRLIAEHVIVSDRRPMLSNTYTGREAMVDGFRTTGTDRPWQVEFDTLATRGTNFALMAQRWSKVDDPGTSLEHLSVVRVDSDGLIDLAVMFDPDDLASAVDELNRLHLETVDPIEAGLWELGHIHYDAINDGDPAAALVVYDPSAVFVDHRLLGWGSIDFEGMRERFSTITAMAHDHLTYMRRLHAQTPEVACATGRNHYVTPEGIEIDDDILSVFTTDPATGLVLGTEQFDPDDLDAGLARFDELATAARARPIATTRAVSIGGYANVSARLPEPDRFIDGLSDDFTATLADGTDVTLDDLRAGTVAAAAIGFGITERELIAVRGERLALLRIEGTRWSIEEFDEHDRLARVTLFANDDLLAARNAFEDAGPRDARCSGRPRECQDVAGRPCELRPRNDRALIA